MSNVTSMLHRNNPDKEPLIGNVKVTREDWLNVAMDVLISDGVEKVKVLTIAERLDVSRSSFYWYFKGRQDLLDSLLELWEATNTAAIVRQTKLPAKTITQACYNFFKCFIDPNLFNSALDFAVRDWAKRSGKVRRILDQSDQTRISAIEEVFRHFGYDETDALTRARILYYMQTGYNAAELNEPIETRLALTPSYILGFTGVRPNDKEHDEFVKYTQEIERRRKS